MPKVKCRPSRVGKKPGPKNVAVKGHNRSTPKALGKNC